jgi:uncharacterized protein YutE (UPF0331/DUF86 family)
MTVDRELVTRKLLLITGDVEQLRAVHAAGEEAYLVDRISQLVSERLLERIVTRMIDVNYHLLTASGNPPPSDYYASFLQLGNIGILESAFAARIASSAGLRNRLVHDYDDLDQRLLFRALAGAMNDVPAYVGAVHAFLEQSSI